ncbi:MAG: PadR family transcriptional regulator, partial [Actinomycetota bacterium]
MEGRWMEAPDMEVRLPATAYAVLGMLSLAPVSGYELTQNVDRTIAHFWTISKSQVYSELQRLEELGLVAGTDVTQERLPDKRIFELTDDGGRALDAWLADPKHERSRLRSGPLLKLFFSHRLDRDRFDALLERYESNARKAREQLGAIVEELADDDAAFYARATALIGLRNADGVTGGSVGLV